MKCHQRIIREKLAKEETKYDLFGAWWKNIDRSLKNATVREIKYHVAAQIILKYEWLGNMGTTEYAFGLYFEDRYLGGVACFGRTAGSHVNNSVCGYKYGDLVITLCRGTCVHWAHEHSASFLIPKACGLMTKKGYNIFVAYADPRAGEIGTVYQACNWLYCGETSPTEKFVEPHTGKIKDARLIHAYTRDRTGGKLTYKRTRAEQKKIMIEQGYEFIPGYPKGRYVGIYGDKRIKKQLRKALRWPILPYPKREKLGK